VDTTTNKLRKYCSTECRRAVNREKANSRYIPDSKKEYRQKYYEDHKEIESKRNKRWASNNKMKLKETNERYRKNNKERLTKYAADWWQNNRLSMTEKRRAYRVRNSKKISELHKKRYNSDIGYRLRSILRTRLNEALKNNQKTGSAVKDLGCSIDELRKYIESRWQPGMSWDNWSKDGWHIDHITPLSAFDLCDPLELKKACHYTNLQPLWAEDNLRKNGRYG
jgi:hypothetical protein